jgi:hypothetical protein
MRARARCDVMTNSQLLVLTLTPAVGAVALLVPPLNAAVARPLQNGPCCTKRVHHEQQMYSVHTEQQHGPIHVVLYKSSLI